MPARFRSLFLLLLIVLARGAPADYVVDYGDGTVQSFSAPPWQGGGHALPPHTYGNNGLYEVKVTADLDCDGDGTADATGVVDTILVNVGNVRQSWNYGDGSPPDTSPDDPCSNPLTPASHAYAAPGTYRARYLALDSGGNLLQDDLVIQVNGIHHFLVEASPSASTCQPLPVTITACLDAACTQVATGYTGTVVITTSSGHGGWSGSGSLSDPATDDGAASYAFLPSDAGRAILQLANVHADDLTITVTEAGTSFTGTSGTIAFRDNAFVITPQTCTGPSCATPAGSSEVVAGRPHRFKVELWRKDASGACAIATAYDSATLSGAGALKAWVERNPQDPGGQAPSLNGVSLPAAPPLGNNLNLTFTAGVATLVLQTNDVGKYHFSLRDDSSGFARDTTGAARPIDGASPELTARPFGLSARSLVSATGTPNPGSNQPTGAAFTCAGCDFSATLAAVAWNAVDDADGDGVPDPGSTLSDNPLTPAYAWPSRLAASAPHAPAGGILGTLTNGTFPANGFGAGKQTVTNLNYSEVGSFTLRASATDFLGSVGVNVPDQGGWVVGRFHPFDFAVTLNNAPSFQPASSGFTYLGQPFGYNTAPSVTITARNRSGGTTKNYDGAWWKLPDLTVSYAPNPALPADTSFDSTAATVSGFDCVTTDACDGTATVLFGGSFVIQRQASDIAPFDASIDLSFPVDDGDARYAANPFTISAVAFDDGDPATTTDSQMRSGRAVLGGTYGQENQALRLYFWTQYFDGSGFVNNDLDTATRYTAVAGNPACAEMRGPVACGDVTLSGTAGHGQWFDLSPPGKAGVLQYTLDVDPWLEYDWNGNGAIDDDPQAQVVFGIFRGDDRMIHWREAR